MVPGNRTLVIISEFLRWSLMCNILCVIFGLLSSSLLLLIVTQCFDCCILQPSSGVPCLSGYINDSTWEIIFKVWLLIKQGIEIYFLNTLNGGYSGWNVVLQLIIIKIRTTVQKITHKILQDPCKFIIELVSSDR